MMMIIDLHSAIRW